MASGAGREEVRSSVVVGSVSSAFLVGSVSSPQLTRPQCRWTCDPLAPSAPSLVRLSAPSAPLLTHTSVAPSRRWICNPSSLHGGCLHRWDEIAWELGRSIERQQTPIRGYRVLASVVGGQWGKLFFYLFNDMRGPPWMACRDAI